MPPPPPPHPSLPPLQLHSVEGMANGVRFGTLAGKERLLVADQASAVLRHGAAAGGQDSAAWRGSAVRGDTLPIRFCN